MTTALDAFRELVLGDGDLQARLLAEPDRGRFVALVQQLADAHGLQVTAEEVESALAEARRHRRDRWV